MNILASSSWAWAELWVKVGFGLVDVYPLYLKLDLFLGIYFLRDSATKRGEEFLGSGRYLKKVKMRSIIYIYFKRM